MTRSYRVHRSPAEPPEALVAGQLAIAVDVDPVGGHDAGGRGDPLQLDDVDQHGPAIALATHACGGDRLQPRQPGELFQCALDRTDYSPVIPVARSVLGHVA